MHFKYLNFAEPLSERAINLAYMALLGRDRFSVPNAFYSIYRASDELTVIVRDILQHDIMRVSVQVIHPGLPIHVDVDRDLVYNFILESGGSQAVTCFYDEADKLVEEVQIDIKRWHQIDTQVRHNVVGLTDRRVAVTAYMPL